MGLAANFSDFSYNKEGSPHYSSVLISLTWDARGVEALGIRPLVLAQERSIKVHNEMCGRVLMMMMNNWTPLCGPQFSLLLTTVVVKPWASYSSSLWPWCPYCKIGTIIEPKWENTFIVRCLKLRIAHNKLHYIIAVLTCPLESCFLSAHPLFTCGISFTYKLLLQMQQAVSGSRYPSHPASGSLKFRTPVLRHLI